MKRKKLAGKDPDFHRRDLWESIENGDYPEYELGVQMIAEEDEFKFDFDVLDPTKLWPEEDVPVKIIGKMTLNRNVDNVFAETEQVAFHPGHVVPGIDFTNDPLLQGRLFSYTDTQLFDLVDRISMNCRLTDLFVRSITTSVMAYRRQTINKGQVSYHKNSLADNTPATCISRKRADMNIIRKKWKGEKCASEAKALKTISLRHSVLEQYERA